MAKNVTVESYVKCMFNFLRNYQTVFKAVYHFAFLPAMYKSICYYQFFFIFAILVAVGLDSKFFWDFQI